VRYVGTGDGSIQIRIGGLDEGAYISDLGFLDGGFDPFEHEIIPKMAATPASPSLPHQKQRQAKGNVFSQVKLLCSGD
jgi:hypothetical protein